MRVKVFLQLEFGRMCSLRAVHIGGSFDCELCGKLRESCQILQTLNDG